MSDYKVEFTLKQHTPMIHFQSEQRGATLRATELKPKFDRFITEKLKLVNPALYKEFQEIIEDKNIFPIKEKNEELKKGSNIYKITLYSKGISAITTPKAYVNKKKETDRTAYQAPYFADVSKSTMSKMDITIVIKSFNTRLLQLLNKCKDYV